MRGRPDRLTKEWIDDDRLLRYKVLMSVDPYSLPRNEEDFRKILLTFMLAICNELQYMNDSRDVESEDYKDCGRGFEANIKVGGTNGTED